MDIDFEWLEPWEVLAANQNFFEQELYLETGEKHMLFGKKVTAIGRRIDRDDVLFLVHDFDFACAVVHLTYSKCKEKDPLRPATKFYADIEDWIQIRMIPDHLEYA